MNDLLAIFHVAEDQGRHSIPIVSESRGSLPSHRPRSAICVPLVFPSAGPGDQSGCPLTPGPSALLALQCFPPFLTQSSSNIFSKGNQLLLYANCSDSRRAGWLFRLYLDPLGSLDAISPPLYFALVFDSNGRTGTQRKGHSFLRAFPLFLCINGVLLHWCVDELFLGELSDGC